MTDRRAAPDPGSTLSDDADRYGVESNDAVQAGSGLTGPELAEVASSVPPLGPLPGSKNAVSFSAAPFLQRHYESKLTAKPRTQLWYL